MYKGTELPNNYDDMTLAQKEAIWLGTLLVYEEPSFFDENYWIDEIVASSGNAIYEDEYIVLYKCYDSCYMLYYRGTGQRHKGDFRYFFDSVECGERAYLTGIGEKYEGVTIREYLREKGYPITAEFWR